MTNHLIKIVCHFYEDNKNHNINTTQSKKDVENNHHIVDITVSTVIEI